jgi:hypothetical protein
MNKMMLSGHSVLRKRDPKAYRITTKKFAGKLYTYEDFLFEFLQNIESTDKIFKVNDNTSIANSIVTKKS